jgi:hypothetical protein
MRPSFFIVGAPKCGTTALSEYLRLHPGVFLSTPKEPNFFASDLPGLLRIDTLERYLDIFAHAPSSARIAGEASAIYLYSAAALPAIRNFDPDARILAMLRNPIELAHALHSQLLYNRTEDESDFEAAWSLQAERAGGRRIPPLCREPALLQYRKVALLGEQVERLVRIFPSNQIKLVFHEDLLRSPRQVYLEVLDFIGVPDDDRVDFPLINANRSIRVQWLARITQHPPRFLMKMSERAKRTLGLQRFGFLDPIRRANSARSRRSPLPPDIVNTLRQEFTADVRLLSEQVGRDLSHWVKEKEQPIKAHPQR